MTEKQLRGPPDYADRMAQIPLERLNRFSIDIDLGVEPEDLTDDERPVYEEMKAYRAANPGTYFPVDD
jgi:hypothetical protein